MGKDAIEDSAVRFAACMIAKDRYHAQIENILLSEDAPDDSRPTRRFFNIAVLAAYEIGKAEGRLP